MPKRAGAGRQPVARAGRGRRAHGVEHHDEVLAAASHLPHLLAFTWSTPWPSAERTLEIFHSYAAGGFRDFTRIASSDRDVARHLSRQSRGGAAYTGCFRDDLDAAARGRRH
ncbi:prephenate dehydrogenase dimerization domain-containing protein [Pseudomonas aeruginosa]